MNSVGANLECVFSVNSVQWNAALLLYNMLVHANQAQSSILNSMRQEGLHTEEPVILQYVGLFAGDYVHVAFGAGLDCNCMYEEQV